MNQIIIKSKRDRKRLTYDTHQADIKQSTQGYGHKLRTSNRIICHNYENEECCTYLTIQIHSQKVINGGFPQYFFF